MSILIATNKQERKDRGKRGVEGGREGHSIFKEWPNMKGK